MDTAQDWQLTRRYRCPNCGKRFAVAEWKQHPKCRQCGSDLRPDDSPDKPLSKDQAKPN